MLGADMKVVGEPKQAVCFTRIAFIENIASGDFHPTDDRPRRFECSIARHISRTRLIDPSVFRVGKLRREYRLRSPCREDGECNQASAAD